MLARPYLSMAIMCDMVMATAWAFLSLMGPWAPFQANGHVNAAITRHSLIQKTNYNITMHNT